MTVSLAPIHFTRDHVVDLEEEGLFEFVNGKLVEKQMSFLTNRAAALIARRLGDFAEKAHAGDVIQEQSFQCFPHDLALVRRPDIVFIAADRLDAIPDEGHVRVAPDLAIEVISPNDKINEFEEKLANYHGAGIRLVWEVNPKFRFIRVHYLDQAPDRLKEADTITTDPVLPEFSVLVKDLLLPAAIKKN